MYVSNRIWMFQEKEKISDESKYTVQFSFMIFRLHIYFCDIQKQGFSYSIGRVMIMYIFHLTFFLQIICTQRK